MKKNILIVSLAFSTMTLLSFYQTFDMKASMDRGKTLYEDNCQSCHMAEGEGLEGVLPPLVPENLADKNKLIKVVLLGIRGPSKIKGIDYDGEMTGGPYTDQQVSDILNYMRNSWGNKGEPVRPEHIQPGLKAPSKNYQPY